MDIGDVQEALRGPRDLVLVEAAAGAGKTHEAVAAAQDMSLAMERGQTALLLTHTNAARDEFAHRFGSSGRAHIQTLDSLAVEIAERYAAHLSLKRPLRPDATHAGHPSFETLRHTVVRLLRDAPAIARGLAARHPAVLVDEHQDSTPDQHELVMRLHATGLVRLRLFGDRLQSIYGFSGPVIPWAALVERHGALTLTQPWRWQHATELGEWLATARTALLSGQPLTLSEPVAGLTVRCWQGAAPQPKQRGECGKSFRDTFNAVALNGRTAVLVRASLHAWQLAVRLGSKVKLYEGADLRHPARWLEAAQAATGDAATLSGLLATTLAESGTGITAPIRDGIAAVCTPQGIVLGRRQRVAPLARFCEIIYERPDLEGWLAALNACLAHQRSLGWTPVRRDALYLLAAMRPPPGGDALDALTAVARARATNHRTPNCAVMTIHRSKGRQFDTVVVPYAGASSFANFHSDDARLLYVALTRACRNIHLLIPSDEPSPLLGIRWT